MNSLNIKPMRQNNPEIEYQSMRTNTVVYGYKAMNKVKARSLLTPETYPVLIFSSGRKAKSRLFLYHMRYEVSMGQKIHLRQFFFVNFQQREGKKIMKEHEPHLYYPAQEWSQRAAERLLELIAICGGRSGKCKSAL